MVRSNPFAGPKKGKAKCQSDDSQPKHQGHPDEQIHKSSYQPPKGIGPKCSAIGPSAATGRKSNAPTIKIVPSNRMAKVTVSSRNVPRPNGADFFAPRNPAIATGAMMGR